ncbi:MAG: GntR family transcriptional regulator [Sandaracinaceae bacterium]
MVYREAGAVRSIVIDLDSTVPLYRQIADGVRGLIANGALAVGETLPSVRKLGASLGVNLNTVAKAYRILADEQVVVMKQGRPATVAAAPAQSEPLDVHARRELEAWIGRLRVRGASRREVEQWMNEALARFYGEEREGR